MSDPTPVVPAPKKKRRLRRWLLPVGAVLVAAWLFFLSYINWAMHQSPEVFGEPESGRMRMTIGLAGQWRSSE